MPSPTRVLKRMAIVLSIGAILGIGAFAVAFTQWGYRRVPTLAATSSLPCAEFLSWDDHNRIYRANEGTYILDIEKGEGRALYIGTFHTNDPDDPQIAEIVDRWDEFQPSVALLESQLGLYLGGLRAGVDMFGEAGAVYALARSHDVPVYSLEPAYEDEVAGLLEDFAPEHVAVYFTMRVFWSECRGKPANSLDSLALHLLRKRTHVDGLRDSITSIGELDAVWSRDFSGLPDWRDAASSDLSTYQVYEDVTTEGGAILSAIANADREVRGRHMCRILIDLLNQGERVFAVVGRSHVIRQEPILRAAFDDDNVLRNLAP